MIAALQQILAELDEMKRRQDEHARMIRQLIQALPRQRQAA